MTQLCVNCSEPFETSDGRRRLCSTECRKERLRIQHLQRQKEYQAKPAAECGYCIRRGWGPCVKHGGPSSYDLKNGRAKRSDDIVQITPSPIGKTYDQLRAEWPETSRRIMEKYGEKKKVSNIIA